MDEKIALANSLATSNLGRPGGDAHIAIDFENQIFGFPNYSSSRFYVVSYIYESEMYSIVSFANSVGQINAVTGKLERTKAFFSTDDIYIVKGEDEELLDDYAYNFILQSTPGDNIFESKDFLDQTCITHTIHRLQNARTQPEPFNEYTREQQEKLTKLEDAFLKLFEPNVVAVSNFLFNRWGGSIEYGDIYSRSLTLAQAMIAGDSKLIIEDVLRNYNQNRGNKISETRSKNRAERLHPFSTHAGKNNTDIKKTFHSDVEQLQSLIKQHAASNSPALVTLITLLVDPDARSSLITGDLNRNSERVYFPNANLSINEFILGKYGFKRSRIVRYLKDSFKTERSRAKKIDSLDEELYGETIASPPRRWKKNTVARLSNEELEQLKKEARSVLSGAPLETYIGYLSGQYDSTKPSQRQRLSRARRKISKAKGG